MYASRLMALHLHDINGVVGHYQPHSLPFDGIIDWSIAMNEVAKSGYCGATAIEVMNWEYSDLTAEEFLCKVFTQAKKLDELRIV